ncbi:hypothetical protein PAPYR_3606 [Paratrimastix pyriformis]|uniref:Uncharacterized protein n=1 Tax=Paratrimastix pyriformis TaxID=342808 RepID=A0ABQ8UR78_9EUKA|nr:hypothetical protein PAPYR_3606 [Paratrimastix pyriformis]
MPTILEAFSPIFSREFGASFVGQRQASFNYVDYTDFLNWFIDDTVKCIFIKILAILEPKLSQSLTPHSDLSFFLRPKDEPLVLSRFEKARITNVIQVALDNFELALPDGTVLCLFQPKDSKRIAGTLIDTIEDWAEGGVPSVTSTTADLGPLLPPGAGSPTRRPAAPPPHSAGGVYPPTVPSLDDRRPEMQRAVDTARQEVGTSRAQLNLVLPRGDSHPSRGFPAPGSVPPIPAIDFTRSTSSSPAGRPPSGASGSIMPPLQPDGSRWQPHPGAGTPAGAKLSASRGLLALPPAGSSSPRHLNRWGACRPSARHPSRPLLPSKAGTSPRKEQRERAREAAEAEAEVERLRRELAQVQHCNRKLGLELSGERKKAQEAGRLEREVEHLRVSQQCKDTEIKARPSPRPPPHAKLWGHDQGASVQAELGRLADELKKLSALPGQLVAERQTNADLYTAIQLVRQEKSSLAQELAEALSKNRALSSSSAATIESLSARLEMFERGPERADAANDPAVEWDSIDSELGRLSREWEAFRRRADELQSAVIVAERELAATRAQLATSSAEVVRVQGFNAVLQSTCQEKARAAAQLQAECEALRADLAATREKFNQKEAQYLQMKYLEDRSAQREAQFRQEEGRLHEQMALYGAKQAEVDGALAQTGALQRDLAAREAFIAQWEEAKGIAENRRLRGALAEAGERVAALTTEAARIPGLQADLVRQEGATAQALQQVAEAQAEAARQAEKAAEQVRQAEARATKAQDLATKAQRRIYQLEEELAQAQEHIGQLEGRLRTGRQQLEEAQARAGQLEARIGQLEARGQLALSPLALLQQHQQQQQQQQQQEQPPQSAPAVRSLLPLGEAAPPDVVSPPLLKVRLPQAAGPLSPLSLPPPAAPISVPALLLAAGSGQGGGPEEDEAVVVTTVDLAARPAAVAAAPRPGSILPEIRDAHLLP